MSVSERERERAVFSLTDLLAGEVQPFHLSQSLTRVLPKQLWPRHAWERERENEIVSLFGGLHVEMLQSMEHAAQIHVYIIIQ